MYRVIQLRQALARRFADVEWPEIESEFWGGPESLLRYVAEGALDAVLDAVQVRGLANSGQLAPRLDDAIRKVGKAGPEKKRAEAKAESAGCIHCGGEGLASVRPRGDGPSYGAACVCAMGRWIKASNEAARAKGDADGSRRLLELADYPGQIRETQDAERESAEAEHHFGGLDLEHREDWLGWTAERLPRMARAARTRSAGRWAEKRFEIAAATACYRAERLDWPQPWEGLEDLAEPGVISRRVEDAPIRGSPLTGEQLMAAARRREELNRQFCEFQAKRDGPGGPGRDEGKGGIE